MLPGILTDTPADVRRLWPVSPKTLPDFLASLTPASQATASLLNFTAKPAQVLPLPADSDGRSNVAVGVAPRQGRWDWAQIVQGLPAGNYAFAATLEPTAATDAVIGWSLACYRFGLKRADAALQPQLDVPPTADLAVATRTIEAVILARDLINTPANRLGPVELAQSLIDLGRHYEAQVKTTTGDELRTGYPAIHAVGGSSSRAPRLVDLTWGDPQAPKVTLVGKGVCFDTGGLNIKSMADMRQMKRDMGGAAVVIAVASMVMSARLPIRLRVLVAAADNVVTGDSMRPGDVLETRAGPTIEIANTDCEGRIILADALAAADDDAPELLIDVATLTGSARVALGGEIGAMFSNDDALAHELQTLSIRADDPLWAMPLWEPYRSRIEGSAGSLLNMADGAYAGAITAALFLREFVVKSRAWVHLDISAWNDRARPGRPVGGEPTGARSLFELIAQRYSGR